MMSGKKTIGLGALMLGVLLLGAPGAQADALKQRQNIVNLIEYAEIILRGDVVAVTDGIENNVPYTEVKLKVKETIRGGAAGEYTFRQFGLLKPRAMGNGLVNYAVTPPGWATYKLNEEVVLFLYKRAKRTGLRTTVGLGQGKLGLHVGRATSQQDNAGLFQDVEVDRSLLNDGDRRLLATKRGPVNAESLLSFVRRAVKDRWIERGRMRHAKR